MNGRRSLERFDGAIQLVALCYQQGDDMVSGHQSDGNKTLFLNHRDLFQAQSNKQVNPENLKVQISDGPAGSYVTPRAFRSRRADGVQEGPRSRPRPIPATHSRMRAELI
jgi:hypothetical protein